MPERTGGDQVTLETMRRTALVSALCAIATCWLAVAPASAATSHPAQVTIRQLGRHCETVHTLVPALRTVVICAYVDVNGLGQPRASLTFSAKQGTMHVVTITTAKFLVNGVTKEVARNIHATFRSTSLVYFDGWWNGGGTHWQSAFLNACAFWFDGARVCTGNRYFYSNRVLRPTTG
jgi:hypothetical protein